MIYCMCACTHSCFMFVCSINAVGVAPCFLVRTAEPPNLKPKCALNSSSAVKLPIVLGVCCWPAREGAANISLTFKDLATTSRHDTKEPAKAAQLSRRSSSCATGPRSAKEALWRGAPNGECRPLARSVFSCRRVHAPLQRRHRMAHLMARISCHFVSGGNWVLCH